MMKSVRALPVAGLLSVIATVPAMAIWMPVIAVPVDRAATVDVVDASRELPGRIDALSFHSHDTAMMCRDVTAFYRSGDQHKLWSGMLRAGRTRTIHMIPVHRDVARLDLNCWALRKPGELDITAEFRGNIRPTISQLHRTEAPASAVPRHQGRPSKKLVTADNF